MLSQHGAWVQERPGGVCVLCLYVGHSTVPLDGLQGRALPHVDLQVGTGSKHDFRTS